MSRTHKRRNSWLKCRRTFHRRSATRPNTARALSATIPCRGHRQARVSLLLFFAVTVRARIFSHQSFFAPGFFRHVPSAFCSFVLTCRSAFHSSPAESSSTRLLVADSSTGCTSAIFRSEEHTSELQSLMRISYAVFCLKQKNKTLSTL